MSSLSPEAYAVIEGRHCDPFHYLGPHVEGEVRLVRVFLPDAEGVAIVVIARDDQRRHGEPGEHRHVAASFWSRGGRKDDEILRLFPECAEHAGNVIEGDPDLAGEQGLLHEIEACRVRIDTVP